MHKGSCLCRSVQYEIDGELGDFVYCHCPSCRKASGTAFAANAPVVRKNFRILGGSEALKEFESSPGKYRVFCGNCGSPIYVRMAAAPDILRIRLGSLDTPFAGKARAHIFVAGKALWDVIADQVPQYEGWAPRHILDIPRSKQ